MAEQKSSTTQDNKPPAWAAPLYKQSGADTGTLYNSGQGGHTYPGSTVSDLSQATMGGVNNLYNAGNGWDTAGATTPLYQGLGAASVGPSYAESNLGDYASGKYLNSENPGNPFYRKRLDNEIQHSNDLLASRSSGGGRYGGNAYNTKSQADSTNNMLLSGLESDWNREQSNQFNANSMMDSARNAGLDRATGIVNSLYGGNQQNFSNRLQGAGAQIQAGNILDTQSQSLLNDAVRQWGGNDNEGWTRLGMLQSAAAGAAGPYGTQTAKSKASGFDVGSMLGGVGELRGK